jgi:hypothetical protein
VDMARDLGLVCENCDGTSWVANQTGSWAICPRCDPKARQELSQTTEEEPVDSVEIADEVSSSSPTLKRHVSRSSSVESLSSGRRSIFSEASTYATGPSFSDGPTTSSLSERLVSLLWLDPELRSLFQEGMHNTTSERCERNFRRSLILWSAELRTQASTSEENKAAGVIKYLARNIAHLFRARMDLQTDEMKSTEPGACLGQEAEEIIDDVVIEDNLDDGEESESEPSEKETDFQHLESFLQSSSALLALKDSFGVFVHPDPVRKAMLEVWPLSHSRRSRQWISYRIKWEVPEFLNERFPEGQHLGDVMTITSEIGPSGEGDLPNAQAKSCRDYLSSHWPDLGPFLLEAIEKLLATSKPG